MKLPPYISLIALSVTEVAHAEGIALGNPVAGASFAWLFGLPLIGAVALLLAMALIKGLRKALLVALLLCSLCVAILSLVGAGGMSNGTAAFWLAGLVLSPWICFAIIAVCFFVGIRFKLSRDR